MKSAFDNKKGKNPLMQMLSYNQRLQNTKVDTLDKMNMTAKELANKLGVSAPIVSAYIHGKSEPVLKVARGL